MLLAGFMPGNAAAHSGSTYIVCNLDQDGGGYLALRACGANTCEHLMNLATNTRLQALEPYSGNSWREVTVLSGKYNLPVGPDGWVNDKYICEVAD